MKRKETKIRYLVNTAAVVVLFAVAVVIGLTGGDVMKLRITPSIWQCGYLIVMAASLNLVLGFLGQLSLGHCGFMAVGAYAAALISLAFQRAGVYTEKSGPVFMLVLVVSFLAAGLLRRRWACWWASPPCGSRATIWPSSPWALA